MPSLVRLLGPLRVVAGHGRTFGPAPCLTPGSLASLPGRIRASGRIQCTGRHQILPGTRILPENGAAEADEAVRAHRHHLRPGLPPQTRTGHHAGPASCPPWPRRPLTNAATCPTAAPGTAPPGCQSARPIPPGPSPPGPSRRAPSPPCEPGPKPPGPSRRAQAAGPKPPRPASRPAQAARPRPRAPNPAGLARWPHARAGASGTGAISLSTARRAPRPDVVRLDRRRVLQQRLGDLPQPLDPVGPGEQRLVADHGQQDQAFVALERVRLGERVLVAEGHRRRGPGSSPGRAPWP